MYSSVQIIDPIIAIASTTQMNGCKSSVRGVKNPIRNLLKKSNQKMGSRSEIKQAPNVRKSLFAFVKNKERKPTYSEGNGHSANVAKLK
jgi:hypothetical protein